MLSLFPTKISADTATSTATQVSPDRDCGAYCLGLVLARLKANALPFDSLRQEASCDEDGRTSLLHLAEALQRQGIFVDTASSRQKSPPTALAIVRIDSDVRGHRIAHFGVLESMSGGDCLLYVSAVLGRARFLEGHRAADSFYDVDV